MKMTTPEGNDLMEVESVDVERGRIVVRGMIMGSMPMVSMIAPSEMRAGLKLLSAGKIFRLLALFFRR